MSITHKSHISPLWLFISSLPLTTSDIFISLFKRKKSMPFWEQRASYFIIDWVKCQENKEEQWCWLQLWKQPSINESSWKVLHTGENLMLKDAATSALLSTPWNAEGSRRCWLAHFSSCFLREAWSQREGTEKGDTQCLYRRTPVLGRSLLL